MTNTNEQLTTEEKIEFTKSFIILNGITDEDLKQELYLAAIEFNCDEFTTKDRKLSMLKLVLEETADDSDCCEELHQHIELASGFLRDIDGIIVRVFGRV